MLLRNFQEMKKNHHTSATCYVADTLRRALSKDRGNATQREGCCGRASEGERMGGGRGGVGSPEGGTQGTRARGGGLLGGKERSCSVCQGDGEDV